MDKQSIVENLAYVNLLDMLTEEEQNLLISRGNELDFSKNENLYMEGTLSDRIFIVLKGRIKIGTYAEDEKEVLKNLIHKGELFGEGAVFGESRRRDFAAAMDDGVIILEIMASEASQIMRTNPEISFKITTQIAQKLRTAERRLEALTFKNSRTRIIEFLKDTARKQGRKVGYETLLRPFLTHQDIGNLTTTSRQTVSSVLNELKGSNMIYYDRHRLLIRDLSVLT
ncbi:MAG TPA: Crp/Fnr family transcriptional regulator [Bacteroidetes bacterium]|nr:Crp/Fnr family transcriptional regulator [Bacteroidota bacterium]